jgi:hypothetical protein
VSAAAGALATSRRVLASLRRGLLEPLPPTLAIEVRPSAVGVVRARRERGRVSLGAAASVDLPPGVLQVSMTQPNVADPERLRAAIRGAAERAGALAGAHAGLVLPDPVGRVALLPDSEVKGRRAAETDELIRFRLRKGVPFEIREARLAHTWGDVPGQPVVVAAALASVVDGYEGACRSAGLEPGQVELAGLALARAAFEPGARGDRVLVNWDEGYVTFVLLRDGWPVVFRTLVGATATSPSEVAREASHTVLYYRERLGGTGFAEARVRYTLDAPAEALAALAPPLGLTPSLLQPWGTLGSDEQGPAAQAVAGAAACVAGRA